MPKTRFLFLAGLCALMVPSAWAGDDLPPFPGDGRDVQASPLTATFTATGRSPTDPVDILADDIPSLRQVLITQARMLAKVKSKPAPGLRLDGVDRMVDADTLARVVEALERWRSSGRPLSDFVRPWQLQGDGRGNIRFTGYYTPSITVSDKARPRFTVPLLRKPEATPLPLPSRAAINSGALSGQGLELAWADMTDLYFLQVQGSGYGVDSATGQRQLFSFGGKNGHPYVSIGKYLVEQGEIAAADISMASIKSWLAAHPDRARQIMELNPSYSFFTTQVAAVTGAAGVELTPMRSVAADSAILPLGSMVLIEMPVLDDLGRVAYHTPRLMAVQDRGGAIKGPGRIDIYTGSGPEAEARAGVLKHFGRVWLLLPRD